MKTFRVLVFPLRYYPDLATGEFLNVGVGLVAPDQSRWDVRVVKKFRGFQRVFPTSQPAALQSTLVRIEREARRIKSRPGTPLFGNEQWDHPREPLERLVSGNRGALRWGEILIETTTSSFTDEIEHWFERLVQIRVSDHPKEVATSSEDSLLEAEFARRGILERLRPAELGGYGGQRFEYTYRNGALNVFDYIDLNFKSSHTILNRGRLWRGSLDIVAEAERDMAFFGLVQFPKRRDLRVDADAAVAMIRHAQLGDSGDVRGRRGRRSWRKGREYSAG